MTFLEVRNISVHYREKQILDNISFSANRGEIVGLLGRNGSGKTTIIKVLAGLIKPNTGNIFLNGFAVKQKDYSEFMGYCPQENSFFEKLTVRENIEYFGRLYNIDKHEIGILVRKISFFLDIENKLDELAVNLSGGQKRRLNIACSIVNSPHILLMDEPSLALDPISRLNLWNFIRTINRSGTTIIMSSNSMEELRALCQRIIAIKNGRVEFVSNASVLNRSSNIENIFSRT